MAFSSGPLPCPMCGATGLNGVLMRRVEKTVLFRESNGSVVATVHPRLAPIAADPDFECLTCVTHWAHAKELERDCAAAGYPIRLS